MTYAVISNLDLDYWFNKHPEAREVRPAYAYAEVVKDFFHGEKADRGALLPWSKTHQNIKLRPGEVSIWAGVNGHGKSMVLNHVILDVLTQGERACIASFEMKPERTMGRMSRQAVGVNQPSPQAIDDFHEWTDGKLWLYDKQGTAKPKEILAVLRYCSYGLMHRGTKAPITHFVIDSLMKCGIGEDDYNGQKAFVDELCAHARDSGMHIHLVAHSRKTESERKVVDKFDVKGSGSITDQVDNVFTVWRNKRKEDEAQKQGNQDAEILKEPDCLLICSKQRNGEWEGKIGLFFHKASLQYTAIEGRPIPYVESRTAAAHPSHQPGVCSFDDFAPGEARQGQAG